MFVEQLITIATIHFLAVMSPGADLAVVIRNSIGQKKIFGILTALGIASGILIHVSYALLGISIIISQTPWIFSIIKYAGAIYLVYLGIQSLRSSGGFEIKSQSVKSALMTPFEAYRTGLLTNLLNPAASIFLLTVFSQVIQPGTPVMYQVVYGLEMVLVTFLWFAFISSIIGNDKVQKTISGYKIWVDRVMGVVLILLAIKVVLG
jgi:RhtB (resistance to homoserine/threonine) family protein